MKLVIKAIPTKPYSIGIPICKNVSHNCPGLERLINYDNTYLNPKTYVKVNSTNIALIKSITLLKGRITHKNNT